MTYEQYCEVFQRHLDRYVHKLKDPVLAASVCGTYFADQTRYILEISRGEDADRIAELTALAQAYEDVVNRARKEWIAE